MDEQPTDRFVVLVEQAAPRGDLYELEQRTMYHVVDRLCDRVIMTFESLVEASLSTATGLWDDYQVSGVSEVCIAPDGQSVIVIYHDGFEERVPLSVPDG